MWSCIVLILAVCVDGFAAAVSLGMKGIRIPTLSAVAISLVGTLFLAAALFMAEIASGIIPSGVSDFLGTGILAAMAVWCAVGGADEEKADKDMSGGLSLTEALLLGAALSIDSLATGFGFGIGLDYKFFAVVGTAAAGFILIEAGYFLGKKIQTFRKKSPMDKRCIYAFSGNNKDF